MQLPQAIAILTLVASASAHAIRREEDKPKADFSRTCDKISVPKGGNHLEAECTRSNGEVLKSSLDLNFCIQHTYGGMEFHEEYVGAFKKAELDLGKLSLHITS
ncbi:unnamed protein product [Aspergillus oryzae var. brunneus]|uniref:Unnamed protein product n=2 Tax=Aspergillus oryzae TaxID=5062 RepID=A0AAN4Y773_ASPOZ|nr:unnamed protein product [Aspergillus oryzae]GMG45967.1 unnamed protein product [Aspergillus oryzae var. brunneus]